MRNYLRQISILLVILLFISCNGGKKNILLQNGNNNIWRVIQITKTRNDSSLFFLKFENNNSYKELYFVNKEFKEMDSNPDIKNYKKWELINDSIIKIGFINYKILSLNDTIGKFLNTKKPSDTLVILNNKFFSIP